jgi:hypothetical protein
VSKPKNAVQLERVYVWYSTQDDAIRMSRDDRHITDEAGNHKGLNIAVHPNRQRQTHRSLDLLLRREGIHRPRRG